MDNEDRELNVKQTAQMLRVHVNTVRNWSDAGVIKVHRTLAGGHRRFLESDVVALQEQMTDNVSTSPKIVWRTDHGVTEPVWPHTWPVPRVGDRIALSGVTVGVNHVVWYPEGEDDSEPFVYVVLH